MKHRAEPPVSGRHQAREEAEKARQRGLDLMPEYRELPRRRGYHYPFRWLTTIVACVLLVSLFGGIWYYHEWTLQVGSQVTASTNGAVGAADTAIFQQASEAAAVAPSGSNADPIVLTYHDIGPNLQRSQYVVQPDQFASQMQMLNLAGYTTLTGAQFLAYTEGQYTPPPRAVLITFDDGTAGLYRYADPILARYHFTAVSFVISGRIGTHRPYYLTWQQVALMQASGRWDFECHTHQLHTRASIAPGVQGSVLSNRLYVDGQREGMASYQQRVTDDLEQALKDFAAQGLPQPRLFAWPFSDVGSAAPDDPEAVQFAAQQIKQRFAVSFVDAADHALPATPELVAGRVIQRLEVTQLDSARSLFDSMERMASLPVGDYDPTSRDATWRLRGGRPAPLVATGGTIGSSDSTISSVTADWAVQRTSRWSAYAVEARVGRISAPHVVAGLRVRVEHGGELSVVVSNAYASIEQDNKVVADVPITAGPHALHIVVTPQATTATVDGRLIGSITAPTNPVDGLGGIGITLERSATSEALPTISQLHVMAP